MNPLLNLAVLLFSADCEGQIRREPGKTPGEPERSPFSPERSPIPWNESNELGAVVLRSGTPVEPKRSPYVCPSCGDSYETPKRCKKCKVKVSRRRRV